MRAIATPMSIAMLGSANRFIKKAVWFGDRQLFNLYAVLFLCRPFAYSTAITKMNPSDAKITALVTCMSIEQANWSMKDSGRGLSPKLAASFAF